MKQVTRIDRRRVSKSVQAGVPLLVVALLCVPLIIVPMTTIWQDGALYLAQAQSYAAEGIGPAATQYLLGTRTWLFPLLLAAAFKLGGVSLGTAAVVVKAGLVGCVFVTYLIGCRIGGRLAGLLAVILATATEYIVLFSNDAKLDAVHSAFMLLSLFLLLRAMHNRRGGQLSVLAGLSLGLAFWVKETAILWWPLPFLALLLCSPKNRQDQGMSAGHVVAFEASAAFAVLCWLAYYYLQTSKLWLVGASLGGGTHVRVAIGATLLLLPVVLWLGRRWLQRVVTRLLALRPWFGMSLLVAWTMVLILILIPRGQPIDSWADLASRFANIPVFFRDVVFSRKPLLLVAMAAWPIALFSPLRRRPAFQLLLLAACLYFPVVFLISTPSAGRSWTSRHLMTVFFLSFICAGAAAAKAATGLLQARPFRRHARALRSFRRVAGPVVVLILGVLALVQSTRIARHYIQSKPLEGPVWFNDAVQETAFWLENRLPAGSSVLLLDKLYSYSIQFLTGARYDFMLSASGASVLMERHMDGWHLVTRRDPSRGFAAPVYMQEYSESPFYFHAYDRTHLMDEIRAGGAQYLMVVTGPNRTLPTREMQYLRDNPMFEREFHKSLQDYGIDIYHVQSQEYSSSAAEYPVEVGIDSLHIWLEHMSGEGLPYDEYTFFNTVGRHGVLIDSPPGEEQEAVSLYLQVGDLFAHHENYETAAFEYRMALEADATLGQQVLEKALALSARGGSEAGAWTVLGRAYESLGQSDVARNAYLHSIETDARCAETRAAAYRGLGRLYLSAGDYERAVEFFEAALDLSIFDAYNTSRELWFARGRQLQASGEFEQALRAYQRSLLSERGDQCESLPEPACPPYLDLVKQYSANKGISPGTGETRPDIVIVDDHAYPALFAHPPAEITYEIQVPAGATLRFSPILAPEVCKLGYGDGVQFDVSVRDAGHFDKIYSQYLDPKNLPMQRGWNPYEIDLSSWAGRTIALTLSTGPGPNGDFRFDWAAWGEPQILQPVARDLPSDSP